MTLKGSGVGERLELYIRNKGYDIKTFAKEYDINYNSLIPITSGKRKLGIKILDKIAAAFPDLNINWLLYGKGPMEIDFSRREGLTDFEYHLASYLKENETTRNAVLKFFNKK